MTRTCTDCPKPISSQGKTGRCKSCVLRAANADPEYRARRIAGIRKKFEDPAHRAKIAALIHLSHMAARECPETAARLNENIRAARARLNDPDVRERYLAGRPAAGRKRTETVFAWCPEEYRQQYHHLVRAKRMHANTARAEIKRRIEADRLAALATHDNLPAAVDYLRRYTAVFKRDEGYLYGTTVLTPEQLIKRALDKGWQPPEWRRAA